MPQDDLQGYLKALPTDDNTRADAWDAYNSAKDPGDFQQRVGKLNLPNNVKADLWDSKYSGKPLAIAHQPQASNPSAPASQPQQSTLSKLWGWANEPINIGGIRKNVAAAKADSESAPSIADSNHPYITAVRKGVEGFGADAANMLLTPMGLGLAATGGVAEGVGTAARVAKVVSGAAAAGFGVHGASDIIQHPGQQPGESEGDWVRRVGGDAAMATGAAGAGIHEVQNLRTTDVAPTPVPVTVDDGTARKTAALGTPGKTPENRVVYVDPKVADKLADFNKADLPGKRVVITKNNRIRLANTNPDVSGFEYQDFTGPDGKVAPHGLVSDYPSDNKIPVSLSTISEDGKRGTTHPGHYLGAEIDREPAQAATPEAPQAPAAVPNVLPSSAEAPTPPTPLPREIPPTEATVDQTPAPQLIETKPVIKNKVVVPAQPEKGIQEVKLPTLQEGLKPGTETPLEQTPVAKLGSNLPAKLSKASPNYGYGDKNFTLKFDDPRDLAAYTLGQLKDNKAHPEFLKYLQDEFPGVTEDQFKNHANVVKETIKEQARIGDPKQGPLKIPALDKDFTPQALTPPTEKAPAYDTEAEAKLRPMLGQLIRTGQLRVGEQASHAIDIAMRESRDPDGSIPSDVRDKVGKILGENVGNSLTPEQMTKLEQRRGATVGTEPQLKIFSDAQADRLRNEGGRKPDGGRTSPDEEDEKFFTSQTRALELIHDPMLSESMRARLNDVIQSNKPFHLTQPENEPYLKYPEPKDLPADHPEAPFASKALGSDVAPITLKNLTAALGRQPRDKFLSTSKSDPHVSPEDRATLAKMMQGEEPERPSQAQLSDLIGGAEDDKGMSVGNIDDSVKRGSEIDEFKRGMYQRALDKFRANTLSATRGIVGKLKQTGISPELQAQLDALPPSAKAHLSETGLFDEKSTGASTSDTGKGPANAQPVKAADQGTKPKAKSSAGKPTRYEGIKTTGLEDELLKRFPDKPNLAQHIDMIQKGIADRVEPKARQEMYKNTLATYAKSLAGDDPYSLKRAVDATKLQITPDEKNGGIGAIIKRSKDVYNPEENRAINASVADAWLGRWENMSNSELIKTATGLRADKLTNAIDQARPIAEDPEERLAQAETYNELLARHQALKDAAGDSKMMSDVMNDLALKRASRDLSQSAMRDVRGRQARTNAIISREFDKLAQLGDALPLSEQYRLYDQMSHGDAPVDNLFQNAIDPSFLDQWQKEHGPVIDANEAVSKLRALSDAARERFVAAGGNLQNYIVNYMPGRYENQARGQRVAERFVNSRSMTGDASFLKQKEYEFHEQALAAGLQPVNTNPFKAVIESVRNVNHATMGLEYKNQMIDSGIAAHYQADQTPPAGWEKLDDSLFSRGNGDYWAPSSAARSFNNFVSRGLKGSWQIPHTDISIYDMLKQTNSTANQFQLGISAFHAVETTWNAGFTDMATGIKRAVNQRQVLKGTGQFLKGLTFVAPLAEDTWHGARGLANYLDPQAATEYHQLGSDLEAANANVDTNPLLNQAQVLKMKAAWLDAAKDPLAAVRAAGHAVSSLNLESLDRFQKNVAIARDNDYTIPSRAAAVAQAAGNLAASTVEAAAFPLMKMLIPRVKIGAFYKMAQQIHEEYNGQDPDVINSHLRQAWNDVDDRFGQVSYENMFMHKITQDIMALTVRSPGWNIGTFRQGLGGVMDLGKSVQTAAQGGKFAVTNRSAYVGSLVMGTMFINAVYQYMHPAAPAPTGMDYFFPRDGTRTAQGEENRMYPKDYVYDYINLFHDPTTTLWHKAAPDISTLSDLIKNEDYYHREIRDPGKSVAANTASTLAYMAHQFQPFSFGNLAESKLRNQSSSAEAFMGILPAPRWVGRTTAENLAAGYAQGHQGSGPQDPVELEKRRSFIQARNDFAQGKITMDDVQDAIDKGKLAPNVAKYMLQSVHTPQIVNWVKKGNLNETEVWNVWNASNDAEKKLLWPTVFRKVAKQTSGEEQEKKLDELQQFSDRVGDVTPEADED